MEQVPKCKSLVATFKDNELMLDGPNLVEYDAGRAKEFHVKVEQSGIRKIIVTSDVDVSVFDLNAVFTRIERLLMLLDGAFIPLDELQFSESETVNESVLSSSARNLEKQRLSYFSSADFCGYKINKLLSFNSILTTELFRKWEELLTELDVVHQMYLYSLSNNGVTVDVKCAFLIELAEPLVEIVKKHTNFFVSLKPGKRGTSLKVCLGALITKYGADIFRSELSNEYEKFLSAAVNSRVRIMHIKREQRGVYFDGKESILYILKMSLLYRRVLFEVLDIDEAVYRDSLLRCISRLDTCNDVLEKFLKRLSQ